MFIEVKTVGTITTPETTMFINSDKVYSIAPDPKDKTTYIRMSHENMATLHVQEDIYNLARRLNVGK